MNHNHSEAFDKDEREQMIELGSDITKGKSGKIYTLTIIGQVEGHQILPEDGYDHRKAYNIYIHR